MNPDKVRTSECNPATNRHPNDLPFFPFLSSFSFLICDLTLPPRIWLSTGRTLRWYSNLDRTLFIAPSSSYVRQVVFLLSRCSYFRRTNLSSRRGREVTKHFRRINLLDPREDQI